MEASREARLGKRKYYGLGLSMLLVAAFLLIQPMQADSALFPSASSCKIRPQFIISPEQSQTTVTTTSTPFKLTPNQPEDPFSMTTVRNGNIVKTTIAEKVIFDCLRNPGDLATIADLNIILEVYENIETRSIIKRIQLAVICLKNNAEGVTPRVIDCTSQTIPSGLEDVTNCTDSSNLLSTVNLTTTSTTTITETITSTSLTTITTTSRTTLTGTATITYDFNHPQEMNSVNRGKIVKTIEVQKEIFLCDMGTNTNNIFTSPDSDDRVVDVVLLREIWENLALLPGDTVVKKKFGSYICSIQPTSVTATRCSFQTIVD